MDILLFCPTTQKSEAKQVLSILEGTTSQPGGSNIDVFDEGNAAPFFGEKNYQAVVIIYTAGAEVSDRLFEIVRYIDERNPPGRFIFLPESSDGKSIPPIFHLIRGQQHHLFFYPSSAQSTNLVEPQLIQFQKAWQEFTAKARSDKPASGQGKPPHATFWLRLFITIFIMVLVGLIAVMIPRGLKVLPKPTSTLTPIHPPTDMVFWLQESFQSVDRNTHWQIQHYYTGQQAIQASFTGDALRLSAEPFVKDAVYQLDSLSSWPLDKLQSLSFSFELSAMTDPGAKSALTFGLYLSEDHSYRLNCLIVPLETDGKIQCQIQSPEQAEPLSNSVSVSLDATHTATLAFDPHTYTFQFFLDGTYFGQREIQAVEYWRTRSFNLQVRHQIQNLSTGSLSCELTALSLAHQP